MSRATRTWIAAAIAVVLVMVGAFALVRASTSRPPADFIGSERCASCHASQYAAWQKSQHAVAMQEATAATVLGRFDGTRFESGGVTSMFFRRGLWRNSSRSVA